MPHLEHNQFYNIEYLITGKCEGGPISEVIAETILFNC